MKFLKKTCLLLVLFLTIIVITGWGSHPSLPKEEDDTKQITVHVFLDKQTYNFGEPVKVKLVAKNESQKVVESYFPSGQSFDLIVYDENNNEVWSWAHGRMFTMALRPFILEAGGEMKFDNVWQQTDNSKNQVKKGKYFLQGELTVSPKIESLKTKIIIQ